MWDCTGSPHPVLELLFRLPTEGRPWSSGVSELYLEQRDHLPDPFQGHIVKSSVERMKWPSVPVSWCSPCGVGREMGVRTSWGLH